MGALAVALLLPTACSSSPDVGGAPPEVPAASVPANPPRPADCGPAPAASPTSPDGWLGLLATTPDDVATVVDDGRGSVVSHAAERPMPLASAVKIVHTAAYGRAVAEGG